eukprot:6094929-Pyramimonas_sp.AAC.1
MNPPPAGTPFPYPTPRCVVCSHVTRPLSASPERTTPQVYALSPHPIGPPCGYMPSPVVRLVHPAGGCPGRR